MLWRQLTLIIPIMILLPFALGEANPVTNGGFEELDSQGFPLHWAPVGGPPTSEIGHYIGFVYRSI